MDKLTVTQLEEWLSNKELGGIVRIIGEQLFDTMRENERLQEALRFYANRENYEAIGGTIPDVLPAICRDHGKKAYKALSYKDSDHAIKT